MKHQVHGDGPSLLLIRPLGGSMALWGTFRERLAQSYRVISYDLPDSGLLTTRKLANDAAKLLQGLGIPRAHVFGISLGGMVASWLAADHAALVDKLCIASAPVAGIELSHAGVGRALRLAACFFRGRSDVEPALVTRVLSRIYRERHPERVAQVERLVRDAPSARTTLLLHALAGLLHDASDVLSRIHAPTLVLAGDRDHLLAPHHARALAAHIPGARFALIADAGHDITLEQPHQTAAAVAQFLA